MTRTGVRLRCISCGHETLQWLGRCPGCGEWGSLVEAPAGGGPAPETVPVPIAEVDGLGAARVPTGVGEFDRVLGGGLVAGSVTLLGGEPGMGKSTLLLQALGAMAAPGRRCLLVSAEESAAQVRLRADRLGTLAADLFVVSETSLPAIAGHVASVAPAVCAIDSIQTVHDPEATGSAGSVSQVRDGAQAIVRMAKARGMAVLLVGHVTKDGGIAGPRALEHVVDTVLSFEGDRHHELRMLRALKHRFGPTEELGLLRMTGEGLAAVDDPSALFLADRRTGASGSVVTCTMEGSRPLCVEVQALVSDSGAPVPRRVSRAVEHTRLAMLLAVLHERARVAFDRADVYVSVAGGVRLGEPGADLAVAVALAGARLGRAVPDDTVVIGELGLGGEVRQVPHLARRINEAQRLGFRRAVVPASAPTTAGIDLVPVDDLSAALRVTVGSDDGAG